MNLLVYILLILLPVIPDEGSVKANSTASVVPVKQVTSVLEDVVAIKGATVASATIGDKAKGQQVHFDSGIHFATGIDTIDTNAKEALTKFAEVLIKTPAITISLVGHTDNISSLELNQNLSLSRARAVAEFLISQKVHPAQLKEIAGMNFSDPVADNATEEGRAANRRVEICIFTPAGAQSAVAVPTEVVSTKSAPDELKKMVEQITNQSTAWNDVEIEIDGLLVNDTRTKAGNEFYDLFYASWNAPETARNFTITISEKPFRLTSTLIVVSINDDIVYQNVLQPRQDLIEAQTEESVSITQDYLANYEQIMKQLNGDDMAGNGIY